MTTSNQYSWIEIAIGTPRNRGVLIQKSHLPDKIRDAIRPNVPLYRSVFLYDTDVYNLAEEAGSIKSYFGDRAIDNILIDIDKGDNTDEKTLDILRGLILELENADIDEQSFQCYFSGSGYHVILSGKLFEFKAGNDLPYIVKQTLKTLIPYLDSSIYMRTGIYRVQHTLNRKTGLYKIPLYKQEVMNKDAKDIFELAEKRLKSN